MKDIYNIDTNKSDLNRKIIFNPELHKYTDDLGNVYTSVTQFIDKYKPKFDELKWATYKAKERNVSVQQVLSEWATVRENSCKRGTETHEFLEDSINNIYENVSEEFKEIVNRTKTDKYKYKIANEKELYFSPLRDRLPKVFYKLVAYINSGYTIYAEVRVFSYKYKIAGTIDILLVRGEEFIILDWKTNKEDMKFESGYYKKEFKVINGQSIKVKTNKWIPTKEYFDFPLNNLMNCKGIIYSLQLSLYSYLIELYGLRCQKLELCHIIDNDFDNVKLHKIEYLKNDVDRVLNFYLKNQTNFITKTNKFGIS